MAYSLAMAQTIHVEGDVPMSGHTTQSEQSPGSFEVVDLGDFPGNRWSLFFTGPLDEQLRNMERLVMVLSSRIDWLSSPLRFSGVVN